MKYDFDSVIDRRNTNSLKWDVEDSILSMSIADMDFQTAPCVKQAIRQKVETGIFGYSIVPEAYYSSYQTWWKNRHHCDIKREWMLYSSGVIPAISSIVRKLTTPGEKICVLSPVYNIFYNSIRNNGREIITSNLLYENGNYSIDFEDLQAKLRDEQTTMLILCNPHNPIGKIWSKEELEMIGTICLKYHVLIVSDEIHCDLLEPKKNYTSFLSVNKQCEQISITCLSTSKAFNLAGLQSACIVVANEHLRHKVWRGLNTDEVAEPNVFACEATIAALQGGEAWLEELRVYISENKKIVKKFLQEQLPFLHYVASDATYLVWIDCQALYPIVDQFCMFLHREHQLLLNSGRDYGENSENFIRMNIACPRAQLQECLKRLKEGAETFFEKFINIC